MHRRLRLPADHRSPAAARAAVRKILVEVGYTDLLDEALLLTTELATNGVVHAGTDLDVDIVADGRGVTVTVSDYRSGRIEAPLITPDVAAEHGRGLLLVDQFATSWGTTHDPTGKGVWFRLERVGPPATPSRRPAGGRARQRREAPARAADHRDDVAAGTSFASPADPLIWLVHVPEDLRSRLSLGQLLPELLVRLCEVIGAAGGAIWLDRADGHGEQCLARHGTADVPVADGAGSADGTADPAPEVPAPAMPATRDPDRPTTGPAPALTMPLPLPRPLAGRIELYAADRDQPAVGDDWLPLAQLSAERMAITVEHDRLRDADQVRRSWLTYLAEASELLAQSLDVSLTLALVPHILVPRLGEWCALHMLDEYGDLRLAASTHADEAALPVLRRLLSTIQPTAGQPTAGQPGAGQPGASQPGASQPGGAGRPGAGSGEADVAERLAEVVAGSAVVPLSRPLEGVAVPLIARGGVLGTLAVGRPAGRRHSPDDTAVISDVARRAALAIENARIHADRAEISQAFQRALLPAELPAPAGVEFAAEYEAASSGTDVGGDFYDVMELGEDHWLLCVGDVCGKGAQAAALTGLVRDVIRVLIRDGRPLDRIVELLNQTLLDQHNGTRYCTLAMAVVAREADGNLSVQLCLSGHDRPYLLPAGGEPDPVGAPGTAVGLLDEVLVTPVKIHLTPGDALVFYTDGVTERRRGAALFGHHRLLRTLRGLTGSPAGTIASTVTNTVRTFSPDPPRDDIAVLVLRNQG